MVVYMGTLIICILLTGISLIIFYIWGKSFFFFLKGKSCASDCVLFGFMILHIVFQPIYLIFLLSRGSFLVLSVIWLIFAFLITIGITVVLQIHKSLRPVFSFDRVSSIVFLINVLVVLLLCIYIGGHPRNTAKDSVQYIERMNEMVYMDTLWNDGNVLEIHQGLNSFYSLFAVMSLVTGIKPIYINNLTMRFLGVILCSMTAFKYGRIAFEKKSPTYPFTVAIMVPLTMMIWNSLYGAGYFFFHRLNESKAYCQVILFPLAVAIFWEMIKENNNRNRLWVEEIVIGLSAVPIAVSSLSIYPVIVFSGAIAILVYDKCKNWLKTVTYSACCMMPNILYTGFYVLYTQGIIRF